MSICACILQVPNEDERAEIMDGLLQNVSYSGDLSGQYLAQRTAVGSLVLFPYVTCTGNGTCGLFSRVGAHECSLEFSISIIQILVITHEHSIC